MSKITILYLCAVVVSLSSVYANDDFRTDFHAAIRPYILECMKEFGLTEADLKKAKESHNSESLGHCFAGCVFKKSGTINEKGEYDADTNIAKMDTFVKDADKLAALKDIARKCETINDSAVSDGEAGCERALLLLKCFSEHKAEIPM